MNHERNGLYLADQWFETRKPSTDATKWSTRCRAHFAQTPRSFASTEGLLFHLLWHPFQWIWIYSSPHASHTKWRSKERGRQIKVRLLTRSVTLGSLQGNESRKFAKYHCSQQYYAMTPIQSTWTVPRWWETSKSSAMASETSMGRLCLYNAVPTNKSIIRP